jgi:hypothetical protein
MLMKIKIVTLDLGDLSGRPQLVNLVHPRQLSDWDPVRKLLRDVKIED